MNPHEAQTAILSHLQMDHADRLQRENATLRETLENERKFLAASREVYSEAMSRLAALEAENKALRDRFAEADTERNGAQGALKAAFARVAELEEANRSNRVVIGGLSAVVDAWKDHCKRLEEAGDAMADWNMNERNLGCDPELAHKWQQAKEAKP